MSWLSRIFRKRKPLSLHRLPWRTRAGVSNLALSIGAATAKTGRGL